jgi:hypothetical protein
MTTLLSCWLYKARRVETRNFDLSDRPIGEGLAVDRFEDVGLQTNPVSVLGSIE